MLMIRQQQLSVHTRGHRSMHDLTGDVNRLVASSNVQNGIANIANLGSTAGIGIIEFEPGLQKDLPDALDRLLPPSREYGHEQTWHDGNGHSHLQATLLGQSVTIPVKDGRLLLGAWQQIILLECDIHPRDRRIAVTLIGEE
jgi:secondary thiamine-phosphate synthase enzyme